MPDDRHHTDPFRPVATHVRPAQEAALYQQVFHAAPAALAVVRQEDGQLLDVNNAFARLVGQPTEHLVGATLDDVAALAEAGLPSALHRSSPVRGDEVTLQVGPDEQRIVLVTVHLLPEREPACQLLTLADITSHKEVEADLIRAKEEAEETSRLKMAILTNITHEVRTPLTVILGFTSMLRKGVRAEYERFVDLVERSGRRLMRMLDTMLDLAQLEAGTLEVDCQPFDVGETVRREADLFRATATEKGLSFQVRASSQACTACGDEHIFASVLGHLLDNAVKFTEEGQIEVALEADHDEVHVHVRDTGIGIGEDLLPKIYDEFVQGSTGLERTHQGNGLGLTVSRRLIEETGGALQVASSKGEGSHFTIVLPRYTPAA
jgi:PAS domain S-box-containing protein